MEERTDKNGNIIDMPIADMKGNLEVVSGLNLAMEEFMKSIGEDDRQILLFKIQGFKQREIAQFMGLKTHSAVSKRLAKLKKEFIAQQLKNENLN